MNKKVLVITLIFVMFLSLPVFADSSHTTMVNKALDLPYEHFLIFEYSGNYYMNVVPTAYPGRDLTIRSNGYIGTTDATNAINHLVWDGVDWLVKDVVSGGRTFTTSSSTALYTNKDIVYNDTPTDVFFSLTLAPITALAQATKQANSLMKHQVVGLVPYLILLLVASIGLVKAFKFLVTQLRGA